MLRREDTMKIVVTRKGEVRGEEEANPFARRRSGLLIPASGEIHRSHSLYRSPEPKNLCVAGCNIVPNLHLIFPYLLDTVKLIFCFLPRKCDTMLSPHEIRRCFLRPSRHQWEISFPGIL
jgi:hypothetical protein